jgi:hypothetical protein
VPWYYHLEHFTFSLYGYLRSAWLCLIVRKWSNITLLVHGANGKYFDIWEPAHLGLKRTPLCGVIVGFEVPELCTPPSAVLAG